jgi:hypothetical protein
MWFLLACNEYELKSERDDPGDRPPREHDPATDTATLSDTGTDPDAGTVPDDTDTDTDPCSHTHTVRIGLAADDWWEGWFAGTHFGELEHWWETGWTEMKVECGSYTLAVYATDLHEAISGFIGEVYVDGELVAQTGDGTWKVYEGEPADPSWRTGGYDDSAWGTATECEYGSATGWWGSSPADLTGNGAWWIWPHACLDLGDAAFRVDVIVE